MGVEKRNILRNISKKTNKNYLLFLLPKPDKVRKHELTQEPLCLEPLAFRIYRQEDPSICSSYH